MGVKPDYEVKISPELEKEMENLDETSDPQLKKALEVVTADLKNAANPGPNASSAPEAPAAPEVPEQDDNSSVEQDLESENGEEEPSESDEDSSSDESSSSQQ